MKIKNICNDENVVKAKSESKMRIKRKVSFIPTEDSLKRMKRAVHEEHIILPNRIVQ